MTSLLSEDLLYTSAFALPLPLPNDPFLWSMEMETNWFPFSDNLNYGSKGAV